MAWATKEDLVKRYGGEFVDKLARRRDYDPETETYVEDNSEERINEVIDLALEDAKYWLTWKISCCFSIKAFNDLIDSGQSFSFLKKFHIKMTIIMLKDGGDCVECKECQDEFSKFCECSKFCTDEGECLVSKSKSKFAVEKTKESCWPTNLCCDQKDCCCE